LGKDTNSAPQENSALKFSAGVEAVTGNADG
jgi:hypothetical protein